jgi:hypothetical protein
MNIKDKAKKVVVDEVIAIGTSAQFRLRRTAANTYIMYRLS